MDWDDVFANMDYIPGGAAYPDRWAEAALAYRSLENDAGRARLNIPYGEGAREAYDVFLPAGKPNGLLIFVHGGYWRAFDRTDFSHLAAGAQSRGWAVALPSYTLAPEAHVSDITLQIACAVEGIAAKQTGPIRLAGHSAGGHLVARMLCDGVLPPDVAARVECCSPISPVSDLRDLRRTALNDVLRLDEAEAAAESPMLLAQSVDCPVDVWVGALERPVFIEQAAGLAKVWNTKLTVAAGLHHFDVIEGMAEARECADRRLSRVVRTSRAADCWVAGWPHRPRVRWRGQGLWRRRGTG